MQNWFRAEDSSDNDIAHENIRHGIDEVTVNVEAELGKTSILVDDFLKLTQGDVLMLNEKVTEPIKVYIEDELCYCAKPGTIGKKIGVSILDTIRKDVEGDE